MNYIHPDGLCWHAVQETFANHTKRKRPFSGVDNTTEPRCPTELTRMQAAGVGYENYAALQQELSSSKGKDLIRVADS
jgi:hypothetical protein